MNWHSPATFSQWRSRWFSIANTGMICLTGLILFLGIRTHWPEQIIGKYLAKTNADRPEKGAIWEAGQGVAAAKARIANIIKYREDLRLNVLKADSFIGLSQSLGPDQWVKIEKETLIRLYQALPPGQARILMEPLRLAWLVKAKGANQILCQGKSQDMSQGMSIYFMNANHQVMGVMDFSAATLKAIQSSRNTGALSLDQLPEFADKIYPAPKFFKAALKLPPDMLENLMEDPVSLMSQKGTLKRVGIANQSEAGYVRIGFEFHNGEDQKEKTRVIQARAKEWAVWQLGLFLQGNTP